MRVIGVTGGIGSGKSALLARLTATHNCKVISADETAHLLSGPGGPCQRPLVELLGEAIIGVDGQIDRAQVARRIFDDRGLREAVNAIIHPAVLSYILDEIAAEQKKGTVDIIFIEAALFIESGYDKIVDELWYVFASVPTRTERLRQARGYTPEKTALIMHSQLSEGEFREKCAFVIDNDADLDRALAQAENWIQS